MFGGPWLAVDSQLIQWVQDLAGYFVLCTTSSSTTHILLDFPCQKSAYELFFCSLMAHSQLPLRDRLLPSQASILIGFPARLWNILSVDFIDLCQPFPTIKSKMQSFLCSSLQANFLLPRFRAMIIFSVLVGPSPQGRTRRTSTTLLLNYPLSLPASKVTLGVGQDWFVDFFLFGSVYFYYAWPVL